MKRESRTVDRSHQVESPLQRHLPLVDLLVDTRAELMELAIASGLKVLHTMLEADRTAICGPRYAHQPERAASRAGRRLRVPGALPSPMSDCKSRRSRSSRTDESMIRAMMSAVTRNSAVHDYKLVDSHNVCTITNLCLASMCSRL